MTNNKKLKFTIGCDPEFNVMLHDSKMNASEIMKSMYKDSFKGSHLGVNFLHGNIGCDGCSSTGEIRPRQSNNISKVINNISFLLKTFAQKSQIFSFSTLSDTGSVGGHIHIGMVNEYAEQNNGRATCQAEKALKKFHKQLASFYLPVMMGENRINLKTRLLSGGYGSITDWRTEVKGSNLVYEFRVPSAEWLTTPKVAYATLCYIACVANEIFFHPNSLRGLKFIWTKENQGKTLQDVVLSDYKLFTEAIINKVKKAVKKFELYKDYKEEIDFILNPAKVIAEKEKSSYDVLKGWKMVSYKIPSKQELNSSKLETEKTININVDDIINKITIPYNSDLNIESFINRLKRKIIAFNWKLNNSYFLFGMRREVKGLHAIKIKRGEDGEETVIEPIKGFEQYRHKSDVEELQKTFINMRNKKEREYGRTKGDLIIIGIPYEERVSPTEKNYRTIINLIHDLEVNKLKSMSTEEWSKHAQGLIDDTADPKGKLLQARQNEDEIPEIEDNQSTRSSARVWMSEEERDQE